MNASEVQIQRAVEDWLCSIGLFPYQVLYSKIGPFLKITFLMKLETSEFLDFINYQNLADKSGIVIIEDTMTIILTGITLDYFFERVLV